MSTAVCNSNLMSPTTEDANGKTNQAGRRIVVAKYKTRLCKNWSNKGVCPYGDICMFAHGDTDLQSEVKFHGTNEDLSSQIGRSITLPSGYELGRGIGRRTGGLQAIMDVHRRYFTTYGGGHGFTADGPFAHLMAPRSNAAYM